MKNLLERSLIKCVGRNQEVAGRPMIFGTTDDFLAVFRLESLNDLPPLSSFQPPQDLMQNADDQLEDYDDSELPEDGDFVGVEGEDGPRISEGLVEDEREIEGTTALEAFDDEEVEEQLLDSEEGEEAENLDDSEEVAVELSESDEESEELPQVLAEAEIDADDLEK